MTAKNLSFLIQPTHVVEADFEIPSIRINRNAGNLSEMLDNEISLLSPKPKFTKSTHLLLPPLPSILSIGSCSHASLSLSSKRDQIGSGSHPSLLKRGGPKSTAQSHLILRPLHRPRHPLHPTLRRLFTSPRHSCKIRRKNCTCREYRN